MPKSQILDPKVLRKSQVIELKDIPVNQYDKSFKESASEFSKEDLLILYHDMQLNREFETMLNALRTVKEYQGIKYTYIGPAHLSVGMEALAAGLGYSLTTDDFYIGAHRAHGEVMAKAFWRIRRSDDKELMEIMEKWPALLKVVEKHCDSADVKDLAKNFFLYGFMCETFGRENGFHKSLGGAPHLAFPDFGIYPNNAIVGGSAGMSTGLALYKKLQKQAGIVVCSIGDGATGCGPVFEAMNFAGMQQFTQLWDEEYRGNLPLMFSIQNNLYAMGGQTAGETMAYDVLARLGAGINADQMHTERIDGLNVFSVIDTHRRKREFLINGRGPVLLDVLTYRQSGHSTTDASSYRTEEEFNLWVEQDSITEYKANMIDHKFADENELVSIEDDVKARIGNLLKISINDEISPLYTLADDPNKIRNLMLSHGHQPKMGEGEPEVLMAKEQSRWQMNQSPLRLRRER